MYCLLIKKITYPKGFHSGYDHVENEKIIGLYNTEKEADEASILFNRKHEVPWGIMGERIDYKSHVIKFENKNV